MNLGIERKKALVLGASRGLGRAIARKLSEEGCQVAVVARNPESLQETMSQLSGSGHCSVACDLLETPAQQVLDQLGDWGRPEVVVHNLGGSLRINDELASSHDYHRVWRLNLGVGLDFNQLLIPAMVEAGWGRVVHVSSVSAFNFTGAVPYVAAKAALNAYVKAAGRALIAKKVVLSAVCPGPLFERGRYLAELQVENGPKWSEYVQHHLPQGRLAEPDEVAVFAVLLCSELASFACGALLNIDGGSM